MGCTIIFVEKKLSNGHNLETRKRVHSFLHGTRRLYLMHIPIKLYEDKMINE